MSDTATTEKMVSPLWASKFWIEIEGLMEAVFTEMSGMQATTEVLSVKEGGLNSYVHHLPVRTTFTNITLKRGMALTPLFWDWYQKTVKGKVERKNIAIIFYSPKEPGVVSHRWQVTGAYPVKWSGPTLSAKSGEFAIETLELTYDWFELSQ